MTNRACQFAQQLGTVTSNAGVSGSDLKFTAKLSETYIIIGTCQVNGTAIYYGTANFYVDFADNIDYNHYFFEQSISPKDSSDYFSVPTVGIYTVDTTPNGLDMYVYAVLNSVSGLTSISMKEQSYIALLKDSKDFVIGQFSGSTSSTSYVSLGTITTTVATTGDYWIVAACGLAKNENTTDLTIGLNIDGVYYCEMNTRENSATLPKVLPWGASVKINLAAGSHTISVDVKVTLSGTASIYFGNCVGIRLDTFSSNNYAEDRNLQTTTNTTPTDKINQTYNLNAKPYLVVTNAIIQRSNATAPASYASLQDSSSFGSGQYTMAAAGAYQLLMSMLKNNYSAGNHQFEVQWWKTSGLGNAGIDEVSLMVLELDPDPTVNILGAKILGANIL